MRIMHLLLLHLTKAAAGAEDPTKMAWLNKDGEIYDVLDKYTGNYALECL